jgi:hypothetical protein
MSPRRRPRSLLAAAVARRRYVLGAVGGNNREASASAFLREIRHDLERRWIGPLEVVEQEDQRSQSRDPVKDAHAVVADPTAWQWRIGVMACRDCRGVVELRCDIRRGCLGSGEYVPRRDGVAGSIRRGRTSVSITSGPC